MAMPDSTRSELKKRLVQRYAALLKRIEYVVGSRDAAADALHETWLRLETMADVAPVANADAYLMGMANNVVVDHYRRERRHVHEDEVDELFQVPDELADPERIVAARRKIERLKVVLANLTPRRRAILMAARVDGQLNREIAERFGISLRLVERELSAALKYCSEHMEDVTRPGELPAGGRRKF
jgi:RNA polymerase sigma factor (sigma-70 family)